MFEPFMYILYAGIILIAIGIKMERSQRTVGKIGEPEGSPVDLHRRLQPYSDHVNARCATVPSESWREQFKEKLVNENEYWRKHPPTPQELDKAEQTYENVRRSIAIHHTEGDQDFKPYPGSDRKPGHTVINPDTGEGWRLSDDETEWEPITVKRKPGYIAFDERSGDVYRLVGEGLDQRYERIDGHFIKDGVTGELLKIDDRSNVFTVDRSWSKDWG